MKKIIPFTKDIKFNTKIFELTSISLENNLNTFKNAEVSGEFIVSGEYKMNDSSINTEPFIYGLPFDIEIDESLDEDSIKVDIDDFKYEIINEEILRVNIDVLLEGSIKIKKEEEIEQLNPDVIIQARQDDIYKKEDDKEDNMIEEDLFKEENNASKVLKEDDNNSTLFNNFPDFDDEYVSYFVHIVRENDNIESICAKYNISSDDLNKYNNDIKITLGNKLIIPYTNDKKI